jgi:hypothetical protein
VRSTRRSSLLLLVLTLSGCGDDRPPNAPTPVPATVVGVAIEGATQRDLGAPGQTLQLRAIATLSDGSRPDVSNEAAWSVADARVLSVSPRGLVTGLADGSAIVNATYRGQAAATILRVASALGPRFLVNGVVRDAERGTPLVGVYVYPWRPGEYPIRAIDAGPRVFTDGNGFFEFGALPAGFAVIASQFGYEDSTVGVPTLTAPASLDIRLKPDTAPYIERTLSGEFDGVDDSGLPTWSTRIVTRGSGVFDVVARARSCAPDGALQILADNGGFGDVSVSSDCGFARLRMNLRASEVKLRLQGLRASGWELTYREPR